MLLGTELSMAFTRLACRRNDSGRSQAASSSSERFSLLQIERVKPFGKPAVDRSKKVVGLIALALVASEPRHAHRVRSSHDLLAAHAPPRARAQNTPLLSRRPMSATSVRSRRRYDRLPLRTTFRGFLLRL